MLSLEEIRVMASYAYLTSKLASLNKNKDGLKCFKIAP